LLFHLNYLLHRVDTCISEYNLDLTTNVTRYRIDLLPDHHDMCCISICLTFLTNFTFFRALYLRDQSIGSSGRSRGRRRTSLPLYSSVCRPAQRRSLRTSAWLAILGSGPPSPRGRPRDQVYTVRGHRSAARSDRRSQRPRPGSHRPQVDSDLEYLPPNTPMQTPPLEPPPYSALSNERTEEPPPAYDSLYPAKESQQGVPPV